MWIRSSTGSLTARKTRLTLAFLAGLLCTTGIGPIVQSVAFAQSDTVDGIQRPDFAPTTEFTASDVDPVTLAILSDALISLRFFAIAELENPEDLGLAQSGVVRGYLARRQKDQAIDIAGLIEDAIWRGRSYIWISDYVYIVEENRDEALSWLTKAVSEVEELSDPYDLGETLHIAAQRLASMRYPLESAAAATKISDPALRIEALQEVAEIALSLSESAETLTTTLSILAGIEEISTSLDLPPIEKAAVFMRTGALQLRAGDEIAAQKNFDVARDLILEVPGDERFKALTNLASNMVEAGNQRGGMAIVRVIPEGADRARALAAVSAALGRRNIDAAVPLFRLAMEETQRIDDQSERFDTLAFLVARQTEVGRLRDAFDAAFQITEDVPRAEALLGMGHVLLEQGKLQEALVLKEYIPYTGMRAQVMGPVAEGRGLEDDPAGASALLAEALDPTGFPYLPRYLPEALDRVLTAQIRGGLPGADQAIFSRARDLAEIIPDELTQVKALVQVAIAEARRGRIDDAQKTISAAYRIAFEHSAVEGFDQALMAISLAQLATGDLIGAYDTAARIPEPPPEGPFPRNPDGSFAVPRYQALIRVAAAAGRLGDPRFGSEVVTRKIANDLAKATGLSAVAIAMANRTTDLIDVINDIQDGALYAPNFDYLTQAIDAPLESLPDAENDLGEAPQLAPLPPPEEGGDEAGEGAAEEETQ